MTEQIEHDQYDKCIFGRVNRNVFDDDGKFVEQIPFYLLVVGVSRFTEQRQEQFGRLLWDFAGHDPLRWEFVDSQERRRFGRMNLGRYNYVEIFTYDDDTWGYRADSSGGGNFPLSSLKIVKEF